MSGNEIGKQRRQAPAGRPGHPVHKQAGPGAIPEPANIQNIPRLVTATCERPPRPAPLCAQTHSAAADDLK